MIILLILLVISYFLYEWKGNPVEMKERKQQQKEYITGTITNQNGNPVSKATVYLLGSSIKSNSNGEGEYSIEATIGDELIISHPKYENHSVEVKDKIQDIRLTSKK